jgi:hypothetical protein
MARMNFAVPAIAACMIAVASPIASATSTMEGEQIVQQPTHPAQHVNMLHMNMCGERDNVVQELSQIFNEAPMAVGQVDENAVVEIFVSETGTWTILATGTDGVSCIVSAGEGFESTSIVRGVDA